MAARMMGCRNATIIGRHIIPNVMGPIIVGATLGVGAAIIIESSLSFPGRASRRPRRPGQHAPGTRRALWRPSPGSRFSWAGDPDHRALYQLPGRRTARRTGSTMRGDS